MTQLASGWIEVTLEEVTEIRDDLRKPVNSEERAIRIGPYPYYGATGQVGWIDDFLMDGEFVLLGEDGAPFLDHEKSKAYIVKGRTWVNNHAHVLRGGQFVTNRFLLHALNATNFRPFVNGTTRLKLTQGSMRKIPLSVPSIAEQDRIVAKIEELFSELDAGVAALVRVRAGLKRYRAAVLKAAVEGKLTEDWRTQHPDTEPASALLDRILAERRRKWEEAQTIRFALSNKKSPKDWSEKYPAPKSPDDTNLAKLPEGWCWVSLDQLSSRSEYGTSVKCDYAANGPPVLRIPNIAKGELDFQDIKNSTVAFNISSDEELLVGDMLACRTNGSINLIGRTAIVKVILKPPHAFASYLLRFRFVERDILPKWIHGFFQSPQGRSFIERHAASSAGQHNVSLNLLNGMHLPLPPLEAQKILVSEVERRFSIVDEIETQVEANLKRAARLRQGILKRAFEGRLVPQDPADEPAEQLLARIRQQRAAEAKPKQSRPRQQSKGNGATPLLPEDNVSPGGQE